jgi:hypothetical protein
MAFRFSKRLHSDGLEAFERCSFVVFWVGYLLHKLLPVMISSYLMSEDDEQQKKKDNDN